ncbi:MAG: amino acid ABC transporter permease [Leptolyngbyaceae cyanobacterium bins.59]|nr:amino acid ABC transporter permease [Leptolyngbyaceae cyanobacterium bins.59]
MMPNRATPDPLQWVRQNLFNTWWNGLLTIACFGILLQGILWAGRWLGQAQWSVIQANWRLLFIGRYPADQAWRVGVGVGILGAALLLSWGLPRWVGPVKAPLLALLLWLPVAPVMLWLIAGGAGLPGVSSTLWGGLLLTLLMAVVSIVLAFPLGILLALGRQGSLPIIRWLSTLYIEIVRGLPLIGILFIAQVMLPLFFPATVTLDRITPAIAGLVLFNAAYLAENVRGGLQSVPRGQVEAARALGLNSFLVVLLIVLPQALRAVIPAIVGQFISLFKDTSLLSIFALLELTGMARSILSQPDFLGRYAEVYLFVGLIYWIFCYSMSLASQRLEQELGVGQR